MGQRQCAHGAQALAEGLRGLLRDAVHQVGADVDKAEIPGGGKSLLKRGIAVQAAERGKLLFVNGLQPDRETVDATFFHGLQAPARAAGGIDLGRDLGIRREGKAGADHLKEPLPLRGREQRRGATADIDCVHKVGQRRAAIGLHLLFQRGKIAVYPLFGAGQRIKVAVGALSRAEGNVDIEAERPLVFWNMEFLHGDSFFI